MENETTIPVLDTEGWYVVEQMGHRRLAGYLTVVLVAGVQMLRIEARGDALIPDRLIHPQTLYGLTPCSEEIARAVLRHGVATPVQPWELEPPRRIPAGNSGENPYHDGGAGEMDDDQDDAGPAVDY